MAYCRESPSERYRELIGLYRRLHAEGEIHQGLVPELTYPGVSLLPHLRRIKLLIDRTGARTVLDYGCGKARQYDAVDLTAPGIGRIERIIDNRDIDEVLCYAPCVPKFDRLSAEPADGGVIATDHCPGEDVPRIVAEMFAHARRCVFAGIASFPAKTRLPNGENAHCTIRPTELWNEVFAVAGRAHPEVVWKIIVDPLAEA